tara:strand:+ start:60 stop:344 length:285 start_codon:yes stop_codon:yes gene_type:complete
MKVSEHKVMKYRQVDTLFVYDGLELRRCGGTNVEAVWIPCFLTYEGDRYNLYIDIYGREYSYRKTAKSMLRIRNVNEIEPVKRKILSLNKPVNN